jgi:hypothetical protein
MSNRKCEPCRIDRTFYLRGLPAERLAIKFLWLLWCFALLLKALGTDAMPARAFLQGRLADEPLREKAS